ncbi:MAG: hypothetical protein QOC66_4351 [Pseudonocardiales bacterium]|nr:hypothetical protein [Pseudonocardiales bacterium]
MPTLTLPQLVAGRDLASAAVRRLGPITDDEVVVDARPLVSGTASFAGQLVRSTVLDGGAARLTLIGGPPDFVDDARSAAVQLGVPDRVAFLAADADLNVAS